ncbi:hypothetical protein [Pseudomonas syringae group genomosp. 3]|uniref:hypothetical protein n=1 Tax=Pseudomonas syringae group genomosp. 3 TaxID=251701 RepID=UPI001067D5A2|nr:hypothetical protein [Pseudomonas syringae group genomosp. 3]TES71929.1 hypothetical protein E2N89_30290 [Pseudomonas syringae pv. tomato]
MEIESQNNASTGNEGLWREHEKRFRELVMAIWPSTPLSEISRKISLPRLQAMVDAGNLTSEHEIGLKDYLGSLPGYGTPGLEDEAKLHHGYLTAHIHLLGAGNEPVPLS